MNLKVIMIERLTGKVMIERPGIRRDKVLEWLNIGGTKVNVNPMINSPRLYEEMLENMTEHCKNRIEDFVDIF